MYIARFIDAHKYFPYNIRLHFYAAKKDEGMGSGWERFVFNKDAPLDDEEVEG